MGISPEFSHLACGETESQRAGVAGPAHEASQSAVDWEQKEGWWQALRVPVVSLEAA